MAILIASGESIILSRVASHQHSQPQDGSVLNYVPPVGAIIPFYDYNAGLTFDPSFWAYCDGANATFAGIGSQATPDLSGRYLVGFGTDGGGDIDTAGWATGAVGNAGNTVNFAHSHTVNAHSHTVNSHTHSIPAHSHTVSSNGAHSHSGLTGGVSNTAGVPTGTYRSHNGSGEVSSSSEVIDVTGIGGSTANEGQHRHSIGSDGSHNHSVTGGSATSGGTSPSTNTASPGTDTALSASQSIQPRSIRVRYLIRIN